MVRYYTFNNNTRYVEVINLLVCVFYLIWKYMYDLIIIFVVNSLYLNIKQVALYFLTNKLET